MSCSGPIVAVDNAHVPLAANEQSGYARGRCTVLVRYSVRHSGRSKPTSMHAPRVPDLLAVRLDRLLAHHARRGSRAAVVGLERHASRAGVDIARL